MGYILSSGRFPTLVHSVTPGRQEQIQSKAVKTRREPDGPREIAVTVQALDDHKAREVVVLDLRSLCDATDFFVIASGTSDTHVRSVAERVIEALKREGRRPHHVEGLAQGRWVLLDFVDFVIHVFHPTLREFYQLERLWADAPLLDLMPGR